MTAISTVLSTVFLPLNLLIYANLAFSDNIISELKWGAMFLSLALVCLAIGLGLYGSYRSKKNGANSYRYQRICNKLGNASGICLVIFSFVISSLDPKGQIWNRSATFYLSIASPCLIGVIISTLISSSFKLPKPERVTVSVECCYQNVGIAQSIAISMFTGPDLADAIGVPLYYGFVEAFVLGIYCVICWKVGWTKAPRDEKFCVVVGTNYESELAEMRDEGQEVIYGMEHELALDYVPSTTSNPISATSVVDGEAQTQQTSSWILSPRNAARYVRDSIFRPSVKNETQNLSPQKGSEGTASFERVSTEDIDEGALLRVTTVKSVDFTSTFSSESPSHESIEVLCAPAVSCLEDITKGGLVVVSGGGTNGVTGIVEEEVSAVINNIVDNVEGAVQGSPL